MKKLLLMMAMCLPIAFTCSCSDDDDNMQKTYTDGWGYYTPAKHLTGITSITYDSEGQVVESFYDTNCEITWSGNHVKTMKLNGTNYVYSYDGDRIAKYTITEYGKTETVTLEYGANGVLKSYNKAQILYDNRIRPNILKYGEQQTTTCEWEGYDIVHITSTSPKDGTTEVIQTFDNNIFNPFYNFLEIEATGLFDGMSTHAYKQRVIVNNERERTLISYEGYQTDEEGYPKSVTVYMSGTEKLRITYKFTYETNDK